MPRVPRTQTHKDALFDITNRTFQGRDLIQPGPKMNALIIGALAKAREKYPVDVYFGAFMSDHFHLLIRADSLKLRAAFMRHFTRKLSMESSRINGWKGSTFPDRYHAAEVSDEPDAHLARLRYQLQNGCKENLVDSPLDWPGAPFAQALVTGEPLKGIWIDRSAFYRARQRGKDVTLEDFTEHLELPLTPLPCWRHLDAETRCRFALDQVRQVEEETADRHRRDGTRSLGVDEVLRDDPERPPRELESTPQPYFHAASKAMAQQMREAIQSIVVAYREAAQRLKRGDLKVEFPKNTFPPSRPFMPPTWAVIPQVEPG